MLLSKKHQVDSSLDDFSGLTGTDSSSFASDQSLSQHSLERISSNENMRQSFDS